MIKKVNSLKRDEYPCYFGTARISFRHAVEYRFNIILYSLGAVFQILLLNSVWTSFASNGSFPGGWSYASLLTYTVISSSLGNLYVTFGTYRYLTEKIKSGDVALELIKPQHLLVHLFMRNLGNTGFVFIFIFIPILIVGFMMGMLPPNSIEHFFFFGISLCLGYLINFGIWMLFALFTFFTLENNGIFILFVVLLDFLSGRIVPINLYPSAIQDVFRFLPFSSLYYDPAQIYLGVHSISKTIIVLVRQLLWNGLLYLLVWLTWKLINRKVIVQGG